MKFRLVFVGLWGALTVLQVLMLVGFDSYFRSLVFGQVIGAYVLMPIDRLFPFASITLIGMPILSALFVYCCAWAMDRAELPRWLFILLGVAVVLGAGLAWTTFSGNYEGWKRTAEISAEREVFGDVDDSREAFYRDILYPMTVAGALWGVYVTSLGGVVYAGLVFVMNRRAASAKNPQS
jgi:hypothetical protein